MSKSIDSKRVMTFVPAEKATAFAETISSAIPYLFGNYDSVCWWSEPKIEHGTEQYRPLEGKLQQTPSVRMEFSIPGDEQVLKTFIDALTKAHPWEEPVILIQEAEILQTQHSGK